MQDIDKIRSFFTHPDGDAGKINDLIRQFFLLIDKKNAGTSIGRKAPVDYENMFSGAHFPEQAGREQDIVREISQLYEGVSLWSHPQTQVNVIPPPTTISIASEVLAARYNENAIWDHYGSSAAKSEVMAIGMLADLIGFNKKSSGGIFTFGGTGCNLYAARIGIEKADPDAKHHGLAKKIRFFCSDISHYSIKSAAIWTGLGLDNVQSISSDDDNVMAVAELERAMEKTMDEGAKIGTIFATMGTTDAFGIDPLKKIFSVRNRIQKKAGYKIHIHADAVIGWPYLTFGSKNMPGCIDEKLKKEIEDVVHHIREVKYADSVGVDFHKTGWCPYLCSAFVVKNKKDLLLLQKTKKEMPYLYHGAGYQPGTFTLESSRPNYAQKALANMMLLGKEGYSALIIHLLSVAGYFRKKLDASSDIEVLNRHNPAFVTDFRIYPGTKYDSRNQRLFEKEMHDQASGGYTRKINEYNKRIAHAMIANAEKKGTSIVSYTDNYKTTKKSRTIVAIKSYPMSPFTENKHMDLLLDDLYAAKKYVDSARE